jgi:hypothetical protein
LMNCVDVFVEIGKRRVFAGGVDWPGWCRSGRDENNALQSLVDYGPRYAQVLQRIDLEFQAPTAASDLIVVERHDGNASTDFGAPAIALDADQAALTGMAFERFQRLLMACWRAFDTAVQRAAGRELRKGPRGGGRDLDEIVDHVNEADQAYLRRLAWKAKHGGKDRADELSRTRQAIIAALQVAVDGELPAQGPRGGVIWPPRYFVRRVAWHVLDHAWEIEDRLS